ncbi:MAG: protein kinase [Pyrinomonadaceae bacterium]
MSDLAKIEEIYHAVLEKPPSMREEFLKKICGDDLELHRQVKSLLSFDEQAGDFIETPPEDIAAAIFARQPDEDLVGKILNHYRILSMLGVGGMGEVYLAEDTNLGRKAALKLLPPQFSENTERRMRFEREARAASALNHPNIITIYGIEHAADLDFIATEFIDGKTLREQIAENHFNWQKTVEIGLQITGALEAAHAVGIIHRDIKPANIMIRPDGYVKVLDFGLAKLTLADAGNFETRDQTGAKNVMGTINYMSPEQALGEKVDERTDIFSLGVVLYEMLSGVQPFQGESDGAIYNQTINKNPPSLSEIKPDIPLEIEKIISRAMKKDREKRYQTASEMRFDLEQLKEISNSFAPNSNSFARRPKNRKLRFLLPLAAAFSAVAISLIGIYLFTGRSSGVKPFDANNSNFSQVTFQSGEELFPSLSPDGKTIIYAGRASGNWDIYSQRIGGTNPLNITKDSDSNDTQAVFSPDGERIAFRSERDGGGIFLMGATGENPKRLSDFGFNPSWSPDGKEVAVALEGISNADSRTLDKSTLWAINAETGEKRLIADFDAVQPAWSPNGKWIAFWTANGKGQRDIQVVDAAGGTPKAVTDDAAVDWNPIWSADGKFLYFASDRGGTMNFWRVAIDEKTGDINGNFQAATIPSSLGEHFSFSRDGKKLVYVQNLSRETIQHVGFDPKTEKVTGQPVGLIEGTQVAYHPAISPDGARIAFGSAVGPVEDIFIVNKDGTGLRNLTDDKAKDRLPRWSPDGDQITFYSNRNGKYEIWSVHPDGSDLRMLTDAPNIPTLRYGVWSPDGKRLAYVSGDDGVAIIDTTKDFHAQTPMILPRIDEKTLFDVWSWSPDGKYLTGVGQGADGFLPGIYSYSVADKTYRKLNEKGGNPMWLNDNRRILFNSDNKIFILDTKTGESREVYASRGNYINQFEITRDDRTIYFGIELLETSIWIVDLQ